MPVQFVCSHCRRMLSVAHRKAGQTVACPKCGQPTLVPSPLPEPAHATATAEPKAAPLLVSEPGAFDDIPVLISETATAATTPLVAPGTAVPVVAPLILQSPATPPLPPAAAVPPPWSPSVAAPETAIGNVVAPTTRAASTHRTRQPDGAVLLVTRKAVYAQAGLVGGLVLLAFLAGLAVGRGNRPAAKTSPGEKTTAVPVALEGHVLYSFSPGESLPDEGATVIALPVDKKPDRKIAARGLRPDDADDLEAAPAAEALRASGAAVARTDHGGQFQLVVSRPGDYSLLIVSHHATRPDGQTIALADQKELASYFVSPSELIGEKRYTIAARRLSGAPPELTHEFGPTN